MLAILVADLRRARPAAGVPTQPGALMALSVKQRNALPPSAFAYPSARKYPVPTNARGIPDASAC